MSYKFPIKTVSVSVGEVSWNKMFPEKAGLSKFVHAYYKALGADNQLLFTFALAGARED